MGWCGVDVAGRGPVGWCGVDVAGRGPVGWCGVDVAGRGPVGWCGVDVAGWHGVDVAGRGPVGWCGVDVANPTTLTPCKNVSQPAQVMPMSVALIIVHHVLGNDRVWPGGIRSWKVSRRRAQAPLHQYGQITKGSVLVLIVL